MNEKSAKMYIVGAGPGDPELITVKGLRLIQEADVIIYTDSLVSSELISNARPEAEIFRSASLSLEEIIGIAAEKIRAGKKVVRVHTGDPAVFGAIHEQMVLLRQLGIDCEVIPGVSSVFAAAAALGQELTMPGLTQTVILTRADGRTPVPEAERLRELARHNCTLAIFLSATLVKKVEEELLAAGWAADTPVAIVQKASWPDQLVIRTTLGQLQSEIKKHEIRSQAMILAGRALDPALENAGQRSLLYDPSFSHAFRRSHTGHD